VPKISLRQRQLYINKRGMTTPPPPPPPPPPPFRVRALRLWTRHSSKTDEQGTAHVQLPYEDRRMVLGVAEPHAQLAMAVVRGASPIQNAGTPGQSCGRVAAKTS